MKFLDLTLPVLHLDEPQLEFGSKQTTAHPKDGLFLYGPLSKPKKTREVRIGVIGTQAGINHFRSWAAQIKKLVSVPPPGKTEKQNRLHLANFPGMEEAFKVSFNEADFVTYPLELRDIDTASRIVNLHEAVSKVVRLTRTKPGVTLAMMKGLSMFGCLSSQRSFLSVADLRQSAQAFRKKRAILARGKARDPICLS